MCHEYARKEQVGDCNQLPLQYLHNKLLYNTQQFAQIVFLRTMTGKKVFRPCSQIYEDGEKDRRGTVCGYSP